MKRGCGLDQEKENQSGKFEWIKMRMRTTMRRMSRKRMRKRR
jgi:hypothetical protein